MEHITTREAYQNLKDAGMKKKPLAEAKKILSQLDNEPHKGQISYTGPSAKGKKLSKKFGQIAENPDNYR